MCICFTTSVRFPFIRCFELLMGNNRKIFIVFSFSFCFVKHSTVRLHAICTRRSDFCLVDVQNAYTHTHTLKLVYTVLLCSTVPFNRSLCYSFFLLLFATAVVVTGIGFVSLYVSRIFGTLYNNTYYNTHTIPYQTIPFIIIVYMHNVLFYGYYFGLRERES